MNNRTRWFVRISKSRVRFAKNPIIGGKTSNFLDLAIKITDDDNEDEKILEFNVFRKSTNTDSTINGSSFHSHDHKNVAHRSMVHRLKSIPLSGDNFDSEVKTVKYAYKNNINMNIDKMIRKKLFSKILSQTASLKC